jgi:hypothetical protein
LAQDYSDPVRLGGRPQKRQPSASAVPSLAFAARRQKGDRRPRASILTAAYHMLKGGTLYHDLGPDHFDRRAKTLQTRRLLTRLQKLGYAIQITTLAA